MGRIVVPSLARSAPRSISGRLVALLLAASIPVCVMASFVAWQNYDFVADEANHRALLARQTVFATLSTVLGNAARLLRGVASVPELRAVGSGCEDALERYAAPLALPFASLAVVDVAGSVRCSTGQRSVIADGPVTDAALRDGAVRDDIAVAGLVASGRAPTGPRSDVILRAVVPMRDGESVVGFVVAGIRRDWLVRPVSILPQKRAESAAWLVDRAGELIAIGDAPDLALPGDMPALDLVERDVPDVRRARNGSLFAYVAAPLLPELRLLVATNVAGDIARAESVLTRRLFELSALLLVGLALVAIGANLIVVRPLRVLSVAVARWREGGAFDADMGSGVPREVHALAISFAQAVGAIAERERQLQSASMRQDVLTQEIHHRVKNNLQIVASLMNLQASRIRLPEAKAEFQSARDRIRALATLHRYLYAHGELHTINMRNFLTELCGQLLQSMGEPPDGTAGARVKLHIEASELQISSDQATPLALIVTEAVSNAAKYAFPEGRRGNIHVRLTTEEDDALLVIEDDGVGMPPGRSETGPGIRDGIGIQLIRGFARQLGASLTVSEEGGTRYELRLTIRRNAAGAEATERLPGHAP